MSTHAATSRCFAAPSTGKSKGKGKHEAKVCGEALRAVGRRPAAAACRRRRPTGRMDLVHSFRLGACRRSVPLLQEVEGSDEEEEEEEEEEGELADAGTVH